MKTHSKNKKLLETRENTSDQVAILSRLVLALYVAWHLTCWEFSGIIWEDIFKSEIIATVFLLMTNQQTLL